MTSLITFIFIMGLLIMAHELGHFLTARIFGIDVEEFGFGYPPRMAKLFIWKNTIFSINWIPFGGFVRFKGENDPQTIDSLSSAPKWARFGTLIGGPMTSLLIGVLLFSSVFTSMGNPRFDKVIITEVAENSPAANAQLQPGDFLKSIAGVNINNLEDVSNIIQSHLDNQIVIEILRHDQELEFTLTPRSNPPEGEGALGIVMTNPIEPINFLKSIPRGIQAVYLQGKQLLSLPIMLINGSINMADVRLLSPKGIYDVYEQVKTSEESKSSPTMQLINVIWFFAVLSSALGFTNLLPIPGLDGGYLLFLLPELIFNKRVPPKFVNLVHFAGFILLVTLMITVFIQDFVNPVVLP